MRRRPPRSTRVRSSAASDVYKRQAILPAIMHIHVMYRAIRWLLEVDPFIFLLDCCSTGCLVAINGEESDLNISRPTCTLNDGGGVGHIGRECQNGRSDTPTANNCAVGRMDGC